MKIKKNRNKNKVENEKLLKKIGKLDVIRRIKTKILSKGFGTFIIILILIAIFGLINFGIKKLDPTPIDCTTSKDFSLTNESKERVKNIDKDVNIYFAGFEETHQDYQLAKQYSKVNSKIKVKIVNIEKELELAKKYKLTSDLPSVVIECGKNSRTLTQYDLVTYDESYNDVDISEQKITSAIINVTADKIPKVYFLTGYSSFGLNEAGYLSLFAEYLDNEVLEYKNLNILNTGKVPDDCDTLIILTPEKDFEDAVANAIIKYIKKGGNILWFNGVYVEDEKLNNVNKVLSQYGIDKFEKGIIYETDTKNIMLGYPTCFMPEIEDADLMKNIKTSAGALFINATKINVNDKKLDELKVDKTDLITSGDTTYFTTNFTANLNKKEDKKGSFILGAKFVRTIEESKDDKKAVESKLIIYANDYFISDQVVQDTSGNQYVTLYLANNADIALNSIAHLTNNDQEITIRKSYSDSQTTFTPSEAAIRIIAIIIFAVPVLIIIAGVIVWNIRRHRK